MAHPLNQAGLSPAAGVCFLMAKKIWRLWAEALGAKAGKTDCEADVVAVIRTLILLCYMGTNCFIVAGVWRHW